MKQYILAFSIFFLLFGAKKTVAQDSLFRKMGIQELFNLATDSSQQLRISRLGVQLASDRIAVVKTARNPILSASASAFYLGNATIFAADFSNKISLALPHFGNSFAVQASQVVFKGGAINNNIAVATLQEQVAFLSFQKNSMDVKLLLAGNYFDLFRLQNQRKIYLENIRLAELRMRNIKKLNQQGMVTKADIIRTELLITNLKTAVQQIDNNITILNSQLNITLGLPTNTYIMPDSSILVNKPIANNYAKALEFAYQNSPDLKVAKLNNSMAERGVNIAKSDLYPSLSLNAANSLSRPITSSSPALDKYSNGWQAGIGISYNISSLYNARKNISYARTQVVQQREVETLQKENIEISVNAAFIKHQEASQLLLAAQKSKELAQENFRIVEKRYLNQMAILTDLLDATNEKLNAELQQKNAEISIIYTYYQLQKSIGNL